MLIDGLEIKWLGHAGFSIKNSSIIYIDPYNISEGLEKADYILITHSHYDHCSLADINKITKEGTKIICPADCQSIITKSNLPVKIEIIEPGMEFNLGNLKVSTLPAYNLDKNFHPKDEGWVGYLVKVNDILIYHAGDTDNIEEMKKLTGHNHAGKKLIALLPVGGRYTMTSDEASEAAQIIKPFLAIPMHYGNLIGTKDDAEDFVNYCKDYKIDAKILEKE